VNPPKRCSAEELDDTAVRSVALITGSARRTGPLACGRFAEEGAHIIAVDLSAQIESVSYAMTRPEGEDRLSLKNPTAVTPVRRPGWA
jgi:NAD(P)-dependent dehydrogenase (short-subunit alcohol dehydrogenase family)